MNERLPDTSKDQLQMDVIARIRELTGGKNFDPERVRKIIETVGARAIALLEADLKERAAKGQLKAKTVELWYQKFEKSQ